jgi:hypothetical protein
MFIMSRYRVLKEQNVSLPFDVQELSATANTSYYNRLLHRSLRLRRVRSNSLVYYSHDNKIWKLKYNLKSSIVWDVTLKSKPKKQPTSKDWGFAS